MTREQEIEQCLRDLVADFHVRRAGGIDSARRAGIQASWGANPANATLDSERLVLLAERALLRPR